VRHHILSNFSDGDRQKLRHIINRATEINDELDTQLMNFMHVQTEAGKLDRRTFLRLPHLVAREVMAAWLRHHNIRNFDQRTIERLVVRAKTLTPGKVTDVSKGYNMAVTKMYLALKGLDR
jgi:hypothetical protein